MATVTNTITKPGGEVATKATVIIELVAGVTITSGFVSATNVEILGRDTFSAGEDGTWSKSLTANSELTPANTMYRVTEQAVGDAESRTVRYLVVPAGAGTHPIATIEYAPVTSVPTVEPSNEVDVAEITADVGPLTINTLQLDAVAGLTVTVPDLAVPVWLEADVACSHTVANAAVNPAIAPVGSTILTDTLGQGQELLGAIGTVAMCRARARLAPHSPGDYGVFVSGTAGDLTVVAQTYAPGRLTALAV